MFLKQKRKEEKKKELNPILTEIGFLVNYISCLILKYLPFIWTRDSSSSAFWVLIVNYMDNILSK